MFFRSEYHFFGTNTKILYFSIIDNVSGNALLLLNLIFAKIVIIIFIKRQKKTNDLINVHMKMLAFDI